jgi:hypothetical protein
MNERDKCRLGRRESTLATTLASTERRKANVNSTLGALPWTASLTVPICNTDNRLFSNSACLAVGS